MIEQISAEQFRAAEGVADWRVAGDSVSVRFRTGSFAIGIALVNAIAVLSEAADHHPDIDLRYTSVTVRLTTHHIGGLSSRDIDLARQISATAHDMGVPVEA
jgi:4a-hydroxytetrahydrobiopterin dehydratase